MLQRRCPPVHPSGGYMERVNDHVTNSVVRGPNDEARADLGQTIQQLSGKWSIRVDRP